MSEINLWTVYYMTTNAKTDVWTKKDFLTGKISRKKLIDKPKYRFTIPIQKLRTLISGEDIYLVCQTNSVFHSKSINLPQSLHQFYPGINGYILPINIRIASQNEFVNFKKHLVVDVSERYSFYKKVWDKLNNDPWLVWRFQKIKEMMNGKYDKFNQEEINNLIRYFQFNQNELKIKGNI